jgi:hypothetical protein
VSRDNPGLKGKVTMRGRLPAAFPLSLTFEETTRPIPRNQILSPQRDDSRTLLWNPPQS